MMFAFLFLLWMSLTSSTTHAFIYLSAYVSKHRTWLSFPSHTTKMMNVFFKQQITATHCCNSWRLCFPVTTAIRVVFHSPAPAPRWHQFEAKIVWQGMIFRALYYRWLNCFCLWLFPSNEYKWIGKCRWGPNWRWRHWFHTGSCRHAKNRDRGGKGKEGGNDWAPFTCSSQPLRCLTLLQCSFLYRSWITIISMDVGQANMKGGLMKYP